MNITNNNHLALSVTNIEAQVQYSKTVIGKAKFNNTSVIIPLDEQQVGWNTRQQQHTATPTEYQGTSSNLTDLSCDCSKESIMFL